MAQDVSLREAIRLIGGFVVEADCWPISKPRWFTNSEYGENYRTGEVEHRSLHVPESVTNASRLRIARLLGLD